MLNKNTLEFVFFCVESVAERLQMPGNVIYQILTEDTDILYQYLIPSYDILHSQGKQYIVDDIIDVMRERGVPV